MALGYLVIASKLGGGKEIIQDNKNGFLIRPSVDSLIKTLKMALKLSDDEVTKITSSALDNVKKKYTLYHEKSPLVENILSQKTKNNFEP